MYASDRSEGFYRHISRQSSRHIQISRHMSRHILSDLLKRFPAETFGSFVIQFFSFCINLSDRRNFERSGFLEIIRMFLRRTEIDRFLEFLILDYDVTCRIFLG
jgi:hypothetical protein